MSEKYRNIIDYTREANKTFSEEPFNPVDSLVLSQLCYSRLELSEKAATSWNMSAGIEIPTSFSVNPPYLRAPSQNNERLISLL